MDKEKLIKQIMAECEADGEPITREEAEEMAEMEIKAKGIKNYVQTEVEKKAKKPRQKKIDEEKKKIIEILQKALTDCGYGAIITNVDKEICFDDFVVNLTRHRPKK